MVDQLSANLEINFNTCVYVCFMHISLSVFTYHFAQIVKSLFLQT